MTTLSHQTFGDRTLSLRSAVSASPALAAGFSRRNERNGKERTTFELPMTRTDIGDFLGLTIETVSRTFTKLKQQGVIELVLSNQVKLLDVEELEGLAAGEQGSSD
jgi:CRP/FNR family transcriptional regulator